VAWIGTTGIFEGIKTAPVCAAEAKSLQTNAELSGAFQQVNLVEPSGIEPLTS